MAPSILGTEKEARYWRFQARPLVVRERFPLAVVCRHLRDCRFCEGRGQPFGRDMCPVVQEVTAERYRQRPAFDFFFCLLTFPFSR